MPNWMSNDLHFTGSSESLQIIKDSGFEFRELYPRPADIQDDDWYASHWGSSAGGYIDISGDAQNTLNIWCRTAWRAPFGFLMYLTKRFDGLRITHKYTEEMCQTIGFAEYHCGRVSLRHFHPDTYTPSALRELSQENTWFDATEYLRFIEDLGCVLQSLETSRRGGPVEFITFDGSHEEFIEIIETQQREEREREAERARQRPPRVVPRVVSQRPRNEITEPIMEPVPIPRRR